MRNHKKHTPDLVCIISALNGGGSQTVLLKLIKAWVAQGKQIAIITFADKSLDKIQLPDCVDRIALGNYKPSSNKITAIFANLKRIASLRKTLKRLNSPVTLSFLSNTNILAILATFKLSTRVIISERNDPARQSFGKVWDWLRRRLYPYADIVTANSKSALRSINQYVPIKKCRLVNNPIFLSSSIENIHLEKPTILAVGRLHHQKAYDVLLEAFAKFHQLHPRWQLVILGEGDLDSVLKVQANTLNITEHIKFKGHVNDPFPYYRAAEIFAMPSRFEGMPNALLEAMSCGLPIIVSDALEGALDIVKHNFSGIVVPAEDPDALAAAFGNLSDNMSLGISLSQNAKQAVQSFHIDKVVSQWNFLFEDK